MPLPSVNHANRLVAPYQCLEPIGFSAPSVTLIPTTPLYGLSEVKLLVVQAIILLSGDRVGHPEENCRGTCLWPALLPPRHSPLPPTGGIFPDLEYGPQRRASSHREKE